MNKESIEKLVGQSVDLGEMTSHEIGNLMTKNLVELGKELAVEASPDGYVDFGDLPSRALPNLGKMVLEHSVNPIPTNKQ